MLQRKSFIFHLQTVLVLYTFATIKPVKRIYHLRISALILNIDKLVAVAGLARVRPSLPRFVSCNFYHTVV